MEKKIDIPDLNGTLYYDAADVLCLQAQNQYTLFYVIDRKAPKEHKVLKCGYGLGHFEPRVAEHGLLRVSKGGIVNPMHVRQIKRDRTIIPTIDCAKFIATPQRCEQLRKLLTGEKVQPLVVDPAQLSFSFSTSLAANR